MKFVPALINADKHVAIKKIEGRGTLYKTPVVKVDIVYNGKKQSRALQWLFDVLNKIVIHISPSEVIHITEVPVKASHYPVVSVLVEKAGYTLPEALLAVSEMCEDCIEVATLELQNNWNAIQNKKKFLEKECPFCIIRKGAYFPSHGHGSCVGEYQED